MTVRVLFVSKAVEAPWNDGSKNLVRDLARNLVRVAPTVMVSSGAAQVGERVRQEEVYREAGSWTPTRAANARVFARLLLGDPLDVWHFVFAPNPVTSSAAWTAKGVARARGWRGKVVQTVASPPRSVDSLVPLLFGDVIVVQSAHTQKRLSLSAPSRAIHVIPPCAEAPRARDDREKASFRDRHGFDAQGPIVLYPGDYEVSSGAETVAIAARGILREIPEAWIVFACRRKTPRAVLAEEAIASRLRGVPRVKFLGDVDDMHALLAVAGVVVMPVDDLLGKVDIPLVVIEALALGAPLVLCSGGPLEAAVTARFIEARDAGGLAREAVRALRGGEEVRDEVARGVLLYHERFAPRVVARAYEPLYERTSP